MHPQPIDVGRLLDDGHWRSRQKLFVFLTALTIVFDGIDNQLLGIAVPAMMRDWSLPRSTFAPVIASSMVGMMIGGAVAGIVGDRFGRRVALIGSVLIFGVLTAAVAFVDGPWALAALRFLAGLGLGGAMPNAAALASEYVPRRHRPFAITLTIVCVPLGGTLAAFVGGHLMPVLGWRALFGLGGLVSVGVAGILVWALPESPRFLARYPERWPELTRILNAIGHDVPPGSSFVDRTEQAIATSSVRTLFTPAFARDTAALWGAMFACMLSVYTAFNWVPTMLTDAKLPIAVASNGLAAFNLGGVAGAISRRLRHLAHRLAPDHARDHGPRRRRHADARRDADRTLGEHFAHRRAARPVRRRHQRDPDHPVRLGRAHVPDNRARHRRRNRGCRRPHRRRPQLVRRIVGARPGRQRELLPADVRRDGVRLRLPRAGAAPRPST